MFLVLSYEKRARSIFLGRCWSGKQKYFFLLFVALYFRRMPNSTDLKN